MIDGEHRFVGLFTGAALHEPVLDTPVVGRRVLAAIHLAGVPLASYSGQRMLEVISRTCPARSCSGRRPRTCTRRPSAC